MPWETLALRLCYGAACLVPVYGCSITTFQVASRSYSSTLRTTRAADEERLGRIPPLPVLLTIAMTIDGGCVKWRVGFAAPEASASQTTRAPTATAGAGIDGGGHQQRAAAHARHWSDARTLLGWPLQNRGGRAGRAPGSGPPWRGRRGNLKFSSCSDLPIRQGHGGRGQDRGRRCWGGKGGCPTGLGVGRRCRPEVRAFQVGASSGMRMGGRRAGLPADADCRGWVSAPLEEPPGLEPAGPQWIAPRANVGAAKCFLRLQRFTAGTAARWWWWWWVMSPKWRSASISRLSALGMAEGFG